VDGGLGQNWPDVTNKGVSMKKRARPNPEKESVCSFSRSQALFDLINVSEKRDKINAYRRDAQLVATFLTHLDIPSIFSIK